MDERELLALMSAFLWKSNSTVAVTEAMEILNQVDKSLAQVKAQVEEDEPERHKRRR